MSDTKSGSKPNLNESTMPLLDEHPEKIELKERDSIGDEKDDSKTEKHDGDGEANNAPVEKQPKKSRTPRVGPPPLTALTVGLSMLDRDDKHVNNHVNIQFDDIIAEPDSTHSFEFAWRIAFLVFSGTRTWVYRLLALLLAFPCAICWGFSFALLAVGHVWFVSPFIRVFTIILHIFQRIWQLVIRAFCDPIFSSCGQCLSNVHIHTQSPVATA